MQALARMLCHVPSIGSCSQFCFILQPHRVAVPFPPTCEAKFGTTLKKLPKNDLNWGLGHLMVQINPPFQTHRFDGTRKQGYVEISNFPISLWDGLVINVSFVCEFKGSSRAPGGWNNGVRHSNDVLQVRDNVKNNKYKDVYGLVTRRLHLPS